MIERLNNLPERIQFLILFIPATVLAAWILMRVVFPPATYESPCPEGQRETVVSRSLMCVSQETWERIQEQEVNETIREIIIEYPDASAPLAPARGAN